MSMFLLCFEGLDVEKMGEFLFKTATYVKSGYEELFKSAHEETVSLYIELNLS